MSSFSSRAPPARPTGISTQNSAAVPKISEAMSRCLAKRASYLAAPEAFRDLAVATITVQGAALRSCPGITPLTAAG